MEKVCTQCGISKDADFDFHFRNVSQGTRHAECKDCTWKRNRSSSARTSQHTSQAKWRSKPENKALLKANHKRWRDANRTHLLNERLKTRFGITLEDYNRRLVSQNGACGICKHPPRKGGRRLSVDHDHSCCPGEKSCGKCIRGLLCQKCNSILGLCRDQVIILDNSKDYLKRYVKPAKTIARDEGKAGDLLEQVSVSD